MSGTVATDAVSRSAAHDGTPSRRPQAQGAAVRGRPRRAQARLAAVRAGGDRDDRRHRLPDHLRHLSVAGALRPALPAADTSSSASTTTRRCSRSPYWWHALVVTLIITVVSVAIELVLGMLLAIVMHRTLFGRGTVRTAILIPYGIVTVVAAFSWQYAWTPSTGLPGRRHFSNGAPLTNQTQAIAVIIIAEVWKTTPFMALLLMAGLALVPEDLQKAAKMDGATALAAVHPDHAAADETGDPGRAAVPHARRVPDLRQHLHPDRRRQRHRLGVDPRLRQPVHRAEPRRSGRPSRC